MTLEEAIKTLNDHGHQHHEGSLWRVYEVSKDERLAADAHPWAPGGRYLTEFEAIAVAEKLRRDAR